jgi:type I restriction enzyme M protein
MATPPGDFVLVVPAEDRKTADHWDFEGKAVCVPLVSSAGHGKADIRRLHYQEGKFALADTMCALFVKDEEEIRPRYLHAFLSAMCQELLVPLMCGATNVTMNSSQLKEVLIPVPKTDLQDEIVEGALFRTAADDLHEVAAVLRGGSSGAAGGDVATEVEAQAIRLMQASSTKTSISVFLPAQATAGARG